MVNIESWEWLLKGFQIDLATQLKSKTVKDYTEHIGYFSRWATEQSKATPSSITKRDIQDFLYFVSSTPAIIVARNGTTRKIHRDENSRWHHYFPLKRFFEWAVKEKYLNQNPIQNIAMRPPRAAPIEPYKQEHINIFINILDHDWNTAKTPRQRVLAARDRAILYLLLDSFIRLEECSHLAINDIDLNKQRILVRQTKNGKPRYAGFGLQTKKALWRYLGLRGNQFAHDALWITEEGHPLTRHGIQDIMKRLKKEAGLQNIKGSIHKLRHTGATLMLKHTRDMKGLKLLLGHSTLAMTERYTQFVEAEDALKAYDDKGPLDLLTN